VRTSLLLGIVLAVVSLSGTGCSPQHAQADSAVQDRTTWRVLGTWSGRGSTQTGSFDVATGALRLRWETRNENSRGAGTFRVSLHSAISGRWLQTVADVRGTGSDAVYLADEPRLSYLVIESQNVEWTATLEEAVSAVGD
jgi:hypothetical protein